MQGGQKIEETNVRIKSDPRLWTVDEVRHGLVGHDEDDGIVTLSTDDGPERRPTDGDGRGWTPTATFQLLEEETGAVIQRNDRTDVDCSHDDDAFTFLHQFDGHLRRRRVQRRLQDRVGVVNVPLHTQP